MLIEPVESGKMTFVSNTTTTVIQQHSNSTYGIEDEGMNKKDNELQGNKDTIGHNFDLTPEIVNMTKVQVESSNSSLSILNITNKEHSNFSTPIEIVNITKVQDFNSSVNIAKEETDPIEEWSFLVLADVHSFTPLSFDPYNKNMETWKTTSPILQSIQMKHNFDFVMLVGDLVSYGGMFNSEIVERLGGNLTESDAVYKAGINCYKSMKELFSEAGYHTILPCVGDHERGGNNGFRYRAKSKLDTVQSYRSSFVDGFMKDQLGNSIIPSEVVGVSSQPFYTKHEGSSYAVQIKNVVVVTVDAFRRLDIEGNYLDREKGFGGEGQITCDVTGDHLNWFENVLKAAKTDDSVDHIFVQAHLPIQQPVRKVDCSGQFVDGGENSDMWRLMNSYGVDIYFAGEVHSNTASTTRINGSNLVQVVTGSVRLSGYTSVTINDNVITLRTFTEYGPKWAFNNQYEETGSLVINKKQKDVQIKATGDLKIVNHDEPMLHFDFTELESLADRKIRGLISPNTNDLYAKSVMVDQIDCKQSVRNQGEFSSQYDAIVENILITEGRRGGGNAAFFNGRSSRFALYGTGPFGAGDTVSFSMWFRTERYDEMLLLYYGNIWGKGMNTAKDHILFSLDGGVPKLYSQFDRILQPVGTGNLSDNNWHHVAVSMPRASCLFSEMQFYVDGEFYPSQINDPLLDQPMFFTTSGKLSFAHLGFSSPGAYEKFSYISPFEGQLDDIMMWSRPLTEKDILRQSNQYHGDKVVKKYEGKCKQVHQSFIRKMVWAKTEQSRCRRKCADRKNCLGYQYNKSIDECLHFSIKPELDDSTIVDSDFQCGIAKYTYERKIWIGGKGQSSL